MTPILGTIASAISGHLSMGERALFASGWSTSTGGSTQAISYLTITTVADPVSFGDLTFSYGNYGSGTSCASATRSVFLQGNASSAALYNGIQYLTFATLGNGTNFGNSTNYKSNAATCSSSTRGVTMGGTNSSNPPPSNAGGVTTGLEYITIATTGNATSFGTSTYPTDAIGGCASTTRGIFGGRTTTVYGRSVDIEYITIASAGTPENFGNCTTANSNCSAASNSTRGIFAGGNSYTTIDYITIASIGNATFFGNTTVNKSSMGANASVAGSIKILIPGGYTGSAPTRVIDQITIATTGNATAFGNLIASHGNYGMTGSSSVHGGI